MSTLSPLFSDAIAYRKATHVFDLLAADLTEETNDTDQTFTILSLAEGDAIRLVDKDLVTAFKDASDEDLDDTKVSLGITGNTNLLLQATQVNENGTEVVRTMGPIGQDALTADTVATADGSDAGTTQTLANALKVELNKLITDVAALHAGPYYVATGAVDVILTVESMSAKALNDIDTGKALFYLDILRKQ